MPEIYLCPSAPKHLCSWEGDPSDIYQHFIEEHEDLLLHDPFFSIHIGDKSENLLLFHKNEMYLFQHKNQNGLLTFCLRFLGSPSHASKINYNIQLFIGPEEITSKLYHPVNGIFEISENVLKTMYNNVEKLDCILSISNYIDEEIDENTDHELEKEDLIADENDTVFILSKSQRLTKKYSMDTALDKPKVIKRHLSLNQTTLSDSDFECDCCRNTLLPPIYLCEKMHNVCNSCRTSPCVICKKNVTERRNTLLEEQSRIHYYWCKFKTNGCRRKFKYNELISHQNNCNYCNYKCPMDCSKIELPYDELKQHILKDHKSLKIIQGSSAMFSSNEDFCLMDSKIGIFKCSFKTVPMSKYQWVCSFCGPSAKSILVEVSFKDDKIKMPMIKNKTTYSLELTQEEMKKRKIKFKNAKILIANLIN